MKQQGHVIQVRDSDGNLLEQLPTGQSSPAPVMVGNADLLMHGSFGRTIRLHPREGAEFTLDLDHITAAAALPASGMPQPIEVSDLPPVFVKGGRIAPGEPPPELTTSSQPPFALLVAAVLAAATAVYAVVRRTRAGSESGSGGDH